MPRLRGDGRERAGLPRAIVLHFDDDPVLSGTFVLRPDWLPNGIAAILDSAEVQKRRGDLRGDNVRFVLNVQEYPESEHDFILRVMERFELCVRYPEPDRGMWLIPQLLDVEEPTVELGPSAAPSVRYVYSAWPPTLIARLIVRTHSMNRNLPRWRSGVLLQLAGNLAVVRASPLQRLVEVSVRGSLESLAGAGEFLRLIRGTFEEFHKSMPGLTVHELVDLRPPARMFISYAREDEELLNELSAHLTVLIREAIVQIWSAKQIEPGQQWQGETANNLEAADIIVLLISADYLASDFTYSIEMKRALDRQREGRAVVSR